MSSRSLQSSSLFAVSGIAFAVGNLCLAAKLTVSDYGALTLFLGIYVVSGHVAPIGVDQLMLRRQIDPGRGTIAVLILLALPVALVTALLAGGIYRMPLAESATLGALTFVGAFVCVAACILRRKGWMIGALALDTGGNWFLLLLGLIGLIVHLTDPVLLFTLLVAGSAAIGWRYVLKYHRVPPAERQSIIFAEALPLLGISVAGTVLIQTERLVIPLMLKLEDLAIFGVLTSLAIAPYRVLASGLGYALTKDLREATRAVRLKVIRRELVICCAALLLATLGVMLLGPVAANLIAGDRYQIGRDLFAAACFSGSVKAAQSLPRSIVTAIGSARDLSLLNGLSWLGIVAGVAGAVILGRYSLVGLLVGAGVGNLVGMLAAALVARSSLARPS